MASRRSSRDVKARIRQKLECVRELHASIAQFIDAQVEKAETMASSLLDESDKSRVISRFVPVSRTLEECENTLFLLQASLPSDELDTETENESETNTPRRPQRDVKVEQFKTEPGKIITEHVQQKPAEQTEQNALSATISKQSLTSVTHRPTVLTSLTDDNVTPAKPTTTSPRRAHVSYSPVHAEHVEDYSSSTSDIGFAQPAPASLGVVVISYEHDEARGDMINSRKHQDGLVETFFSRDLTKQDLQPPTSTKRKEIQDRTDASTTKEWDTVKPDCHPKGLLLHSERNPQSGYQKSVQKTSKQAKATKSGHYEATASPESSSKERDSHESEFNSERRNEQQACRGSPEYSSSTKKKKVPTATLR